MEGIAHVQTMLLIVNILFMNNKVISEAISIALGIGIIAITFGLISKEAGLSLWQTQSLSLFALTGASQFTFVGHNVQHKHKFAAILE